MSASNSSEPPPPLSSATCSQCCGSSRRRNILFAVLGVAIAALAWQHFSDPESFHWPVADEDFIAGGSGSKTVDRIIERNGRRFLWAGQDEAMHFDVTQSSLKLENLHYGLGREAFPALIEPRFISAREASKWLSPEARVLAVKIGGEHKVYPVDLLIHHEVVNDVVGGRPVFAAYCILADLGAMYDRRLGEHTLTFGVSGYTYAEKEVWSGLGAFVLWDRETESLWWPPTGRAVSGPLQGQPLMLLETELWHQTTWGKVREEDPNVLVLDRGQDLVRPARWNKLALQSVPDVSNKPNRIAPRWGQNP